MKLTQKALSLISDPQSRMQIALALRISDQTMRRYIKDNDDELTKAAALEVIRKVTGLENEEILEVVPEEKGAA